MAQPIDWSKLNGLALGKGGWNLNRCLMQSISWITGEEGAARSSQPKSVHPVLRTIGVSVNDSAPDDERRAELVALIPALIGTNTPEIGERLIWAAFNEVGRRIPLDFPLVSDRSSAIEFCNHYLRNFYQGSETVNNIREVLVGCKNPQLLFNLNNHSVALVSQLMRVGGYRAALSTDETSVVPATITDWDEHKAFFMRMISEGTLTSIDDLVIGDLPEFAPDQADPPTFTPAPEAQFAYTASYAKAIAGLNTSWAGFPEFAQPGYPPPYAPNQHLFITPAPIKPSLSERIVKWLAR